MNKPAGKRNAGNGLFTNDHFQVAYCTNNMERACEVFASRYGVKEFGVLEGEMEEGGFIQLKAAWVGGIMIEITEAKGPGSEFYNERLPSDEFAIRHHHLGYLLQSEDEWNAVEDEINRGGWKVPLRTDVEGFIKAIYIEAPELGHYLEFIYPEAAGISFFEGMPSN